MSCVDGTMSFVAIYSNTTVYDHTFSHEHDVHNHIPADIYTDIHTDVYAVIVILCDFH